MKLVTLNKSKLQETLNITLDINDIDQILTNVLLENKAQSNIKGFRVGKAPISILIQKNEPHIVQSIVEKVINLMQTLHQNYINEQKIHKIIINKITVQSANNNEIIFEIIFEHILKVNFGNLNEISLIKPRIKAEESQINEFLQKSSDNAKNYVINTDIDTKIQENDMVVAIFIGQVKNLPNNIITKEVKIEIDANQMESNIISDIIGKKVNDIIQINKIDECKHIFDKDFDNITNVSIKINSIHNKKLMRINDELAQFYNVENLDALKNLARTQINIENKSLANSYLHKMLLDELDKNINVEVPGRLINQEIEQIKNQIDKDDQLSEEKIKKLAIRRVKLGLIVSDIANAHNINVTKEDIQNIINNAKNNMNIKPQQLAELMSNNNFRQHIIASLIEEKVIDFITSQADIKEQDLTLAQVQSALEFNEDIS